MKKSSILWLTFLCACQKPADTAPATPVTNPVSSTTTTTLPDPLPWVSYLTSDLKSDTTLFAQPKQVGIMTDGSLVETSGLAPSRRNSGYLWTEEDSGNPNQIREVLIRTYGQVFYYIRQPGESIAESLKRAPVCCH